MTKVVDEKITIQSAPKASSQNVQANIEQIIGDVDTLVTQLGDFLKDVRQTSKMMDSFVETCIHEFKSCFETLKEDAGITAHLKDLFSSHSTKEKEDKVTKLVGAIVAKKKEVEKAQ